MPIIKILNRDYQIACGDGEEKKLLELAKKLDKRLAENSRLFKGANESMLMVLTALTLEDFTHDLQQQNAALQTKLNQAMESSSQAIDQQLDEVTSRIDAIASYIELKK